MSTRSEYRARARAALGDNIFSTSWLLTLVVVLISNAIISGLTATRFGSPIALILYGPICVGVCTFLLHTVRNTDQKNKLDPVLDGFTKDFAGSLLVGLVTQILILLWTLLFIIPGIIKALAYSMVYYIKVDHPEYDFRKCQQESHRLMQGHKMELFLLWLSFLGWYIVGALCLGIGVLWVDAYRQAATTAFYEDLILADAQGSGAIYGTATESAADASQSNPDDSAPQA